MDLREHADTVEHLVLTGQVDPCITEIVDMKKLPLALERLQQRHLRGKTVLRFNWCVSCARVGVCCCLRAFPCVVLEIERLLLPSVLHLSASRAPSPRTSASDTYSQQRNLLYDLPRTPSPPLHPPVLDGFVADEVPMERPWTATRIGGGVDEMLLAAPPPVPLAAGAAHAPAAKAKARSSKDRAKEGAGEG